MLKRRVASRRPGDRRVLAAGAAAAALTLILWSALTPVLNAPKPAAPAVLNPPPAPSSSILSPSPATPSPQSQSTPAPSVPPPAPPASSTQAAMREAVDPRKRFVIDLPESWDVRSVDDGARDAVVGLGPAGADGKRVNVVVDGTTMPTPMSAMEAAKYAENGLRRLTAYQPLQAGPSSVGGMPAYFRMFTHTEHGARLFEVQLYVTRGPQFYILSGTTRSDRTQIPRDLPLILQIIGTFRLLPSR